MGSSGPRPGPAPLLLLLVLLGAERPGATELTFELPDSAEQCFHEAVESGVKFSLDFQVSPAAGRGGPPGPACMGGRMYSEAWATCRAGGLTAPRLRRGGCSLVRTAAAPSAGGGLCAGRCCGSCHVARESPAPAPLPPRTGLAGSRSPRRGLSPRLVSRPRVGGHLLADLSELGLFGPRE
ncbi:transmembrane emp24 domain-containing protein 3 isoform X2 [Manis pentadactyla]|uniref:transmembrane emp24 domain-containing protein 3 isoform X2 n=1 Tax=Manis pentadactyla TaxID=143292 RepID=UPI00255CF67F|nr:transmembrane emp24 domain-containing protein 3 isoform X2 [Manis pentadactyla]